MPVNKQAVELRDVKEGYASGLAEPCAMADTIAEAKAIYRYTVEYFGEGQAQEHLDGLEYSLDLLADNPNRGRLFDEKIRRYVY